MSWFDATGFANLAKSALKEAQKTIDKALDIKDEEQHALGSQTTLTSSGEVDSDTFFTAWGVENPTGSLDSLKGIPTPTSSTSSSNKRLTSSTSLWGSFTGSFFDNPPKTTTEGESSSTSESPNRPTNLISNQPKKSTFRSLSLDLPPSGEVSSASHTGGQTGSEDDKKRSSEHDEEIQGETSGPSTSTSNEPKEEEEEGDETDEGNSIREEIKNYPPVEVVFRERKPRNYNNRLSAISSESDRRSSESCEVIGLLTPDSDRTASISTSSSVARLRQSGSFGSVEVLTSPSSVEVLGSTSSNTSADEVNKERYSSDSISPVAENEGVEVIPELLEDDEETSLAEDSYTSASESTLNTTVIEYYHPADTLRLDLINWDYTFEDVSPRDSALSRSSTSLTHMHTSMNQSSSPLVSDQASCSAVIENQLQTSTSSRLSDSASESFKTLDLRSNESSAISLEGVRNDSQPSTSAISRDIEQESGQSTEATNISGSASLHAKNMKAATGESEVQTLAVCDLESVSVASEGQGVVDNTSSCEEGTLIDSSTEEVPLHVSTSSSSSYLKNMLADAMSEKAKENSPQSSESRSDMVKVGSSGHTSGDELETATSSDIEIISSPTPNGDSSSAASRQSPAKLHQDKVSRPRFGSWLTLSGRTPLYEALDTYSGKQKGHQREPSETSSGGSDDNSEVEKLLKKLSEMTEILEARESKLIDLSRMNADLQETNSDLRSQLESQDMSQMSEEFMQRLAALERKFQQAIREKEVLRKQLEHAKAAAVASEKEAESEKDQVIVELREEGEKLSKQQLALNNAIKKLRVTEKDNQKSITSFKEQLDEASQELERAKKALSAKEDVERLQIEAVHQLTKANQQYDKSVSKLQSQVDSLTSTLVSAQRELEETKEECAALKEHAAEAVVSAEAGVRQRLEEELESAAVQHENLEGTIQDLRDKLTQALEFNLQRESEMRQENTDLLRRLEASELRSEELSDTVSTATRPLLRQIEALTSSASSASSSFEKQEKTLIQTISDLQSQLTMLEESERASREECVRLGSQNSNLEMKLSSAQLENENLKKKITSLTSQNNSLKEDNLRLAKQWENEKSVLQLAADEARREVTALEQQLAVERAAVDAEKRRNDMLRESLKTRGSAAAGASPPHTASPRSSPTLSFGHASVAESMGSNVWPTFGDDMFESASTSGRMGSVYESLRPGHNASFLEGLQAHLKLRDGEVQQMQWEMNKRDAERASLRDEVAKLTTKTEEQEGQLSALSTQYDALLQMYGEKMEESQELKMDLQDVKDMYKAQIDQLLKKEPSVNS